MKQVVETPTIFRGVSARRREWLVTIAIAAAASLLLILPYALGHLLADEGNVFTGLLINIDDSTYLSAIEQGRSGEWTYRILFTSEAHTPIFIEGFYLALGHASRHLGLSALQIWHLARLIVDFILFLVLYAFISYFLSGARQRRVATLLAMFGAGYDLWPFPAFLERAGTLSAIPVDLRMPESHLFYSALTFPHVSAGIALIMGTFLPVLTAFSQERGSRRRWFWAFLAGISLLALGIVYPFLIYLVVPVLGVYTLLIFRREKRILWTNGLMVAAVLTIPAPLFLYYAFALHGSEVYTTWSDQAVTLSPNPLHFLFSYAPYLLLGALSLKKLNGLTEAEQWKRYFLWTWVGLAAILLYTPVNPQRRFVQGIQVPLSILAADGLFLVALPWIMRLRFANRLLRHPRYDETGLSRLLTTLFVLATSVVSLYLYLSAILTLSVQQPYPLFRPEAELEAIAWLKDNTSPQDLVLCAYWTGSYIPSKTGNVVFIGNRFETNDFSGKDRMTQRFFDPTTSDQWRTSLLEEYGIDYVFAGRAERDLGGFDLEAAPYLRPVFANGEAAVYRVTLDH